MVNLNFSRLILTVALGLILIIPGRGDCVEIADGKISLNGVYHGWTGYRWGAYGEERGEGLSMFRNSLQLEGEVQFTNKTFFHAIFRADREPSYDLEKEAYELGNFEKDHLNEAEFREYYLGMQVTDRVWTALGRQQLVWGDVSGFRVMDIVNPLDLRWHFSLESWEDIRIPLNMVNTIISVPEANGNLQLVWVPGIDERYNRVNRSFGNPGHRWGVNNPPGVGEPGEIFAAVEDAEADPNGISGDLDDGDYGFRWQQTIGGLTFALMEMYKYNADPAVYYTGSPLSGNNINVKYLRTNVIGGSFNFYDNITEGVWRGEAGFFNNLPYTADSRLTIDGQANDDFYHLEKKDVIKFALGYDRNFSFNWLDPTRSVITQFQIIGTYIFDHQDDLIVPGYNTEIKEFDLITTFFLNWGWDKDHWAINLYPAVNFDRKWGMCQAWIDYKPRWMNGLTLTPKVNYFWGEDAYTGDFALVRGNSEVLFEIKYEF